MQRFESQYLKSVPEFKRRFVGSIFPEKFQFQNKKVRTTDINPILHKIAHFNRVNKENKKRDKSQKQDLSRCVAGAGVTHFVRWTFFENSPKKLRLLCNLTFSFISKMMQASLGPKNKNSLISQGVFL